MIRVETVVVCLRTSNIHLDAYSRFWGRKDACIIEVGALSNNFLEYAAVSTAKTTLAR